MKRILRPLFDVFLSIHTLFAYKLSLKFRCLNRKKVREDKT